MKKYSLLVFVILFFCLNIFAQSGKIKYETIHSTEFWGEYKAELILIFNKNQSHSIQDIKPYKIKEGKYTTSSKGQYNSMYIDTKTQQANVYIKKHHKKMLKTTIFLEKKDWVIHEEFKTLLGYKVQKATLSYDYTPKSIEANTFGDIEVWFTLDIPADTGPNVTTGNRDMPLWGLPGLILEVDYPKAGWTIRVLDIQLSKEELSLEIPEEATEIDNKKFWKQ